MTSKSLDTIPDSIGIKVLEHSGADVGELRSLIHCVYGSCGQRSLLSYLIDRHKTLENVFLRITYHGERMRFKYIALVLPLRHDKCCSKAF